MKLLMILSFIFITLNLSQASEGIGGVIGGSGRTWQQEMRRRSIHIDWPVIRYPESGRTYGIHEVCIKNNDTLLTKKKVVIYSWQLKNWKWKKVYKENGRRKLKRVFDAKKNCVARSHYNCNLADTYVPKEVPVAIYKNPPREEAGELVTFLHTNDPRMVENFKIPNCQ